MFLNMFPTPKIMAAQFASMPLLNALMERPNMSVQAVTYFVSLVTIVALEIRIIVQHHMGLDAE